MAESVTVLVTRHCIEVLLL